MEALKNLWKPILAVCVFLVIQALMGMIILIPYMVASATKGETATSGDYPPSVLALAVALSGVLTALICWKGLKMVHMKTTFDLKSHTVGLLALGFLAAILGVLGTDLLGEQFDLPNLMEEEMKAMAGTVMGMLAIGLIGPVMEELIFREAILGHMLRKGIKPWPAMIGSAVLFGLIHLNPAQILFAMPMGLVLAILYYRTGNIVLTSIVHIFNNSLAVVEMNLLGDKIGTFTYTNDVFGGMTNTVVVMVLSLTLSIMLLRMFWQKTKTLEWEEPEETVPAETNPDIPAE